MRIAKLFLCICAFLFSVGFNSKLSAGQLKPEIPPNAILKFVDCSLLWDRNSICLSFNEEANNLVISIVFVNEHRQKIEYPRDQGQVVELYIGAITSEATKEIVIPGGSAETFLITLLKKAGASEKDETAQKNIGSCIESLERRNQSWEAVSGKFAIDEKAFKDKIKRAFYK